jgi:hypothetical protein
LSDSSLFSTIHLYKCTKAMLMNCAVGNIRRLIQGSEYAQTYLSRSLLATTRYYTTSEFNDFGSAVRAGELMGVPRSALDGCSVCNQVLGPNPNFPKWIAQWIQLHDGYDENHAGSGSIIGAMGHCPTRAGNRCGKYCCSDMVHTEDIQ